MKAGKAFELFVKHILINIGFSDVKSDGLYIFDGAAGQMIQGLGEAHNADVLLEPPVQTPFYSRTRLLIECKDYCKKVGLDTIRGALGLREDINHFDIVDMNRLLARRRQNRIGLVYDYERYTYRVAVASLSGFTVQAQEFAASHRIPLLEFDRMPFWNAFCELLGYYNVLAVGRMRSPRISPTHIAEDQIIEFADNIGRRMAVAITNSGQLLFLYRISGDENCFSTSYTLHWSEPSQPWQLKSGQQSYLFQLPKSIMKIWLKSSADDLALKKEAINCKAGLLSSMIVYYTNYCLPTVKMISIDKYDLDQARQRLNG